MKLPIFHSRASLAATAFNNARWFAGLLAGTAVLGSGSAQAATWKAAAATTDWNTFSNWSGTTGGSGPVIINSIGTNVATISANISPIPTNILVGFSAPAQVNHVAGDASVEAGNDLMLGRSGAATGTYNLANTALAGGTLTNFGLGSGNLTIPNSVYVGGFISAATGTLNIRTSGTLAVGNQLLVGNLGGTGTVKMDAGTLTVVNAMEIGNEAGSTGTFSMSGGTVTKSGAATAVTIGGGVTADGGTGTANLNGGTFTVAGDFRVGHNLSSPSVPDSSGVLNLGGAALTVNGEFFVGNNTGANGVMNFTSGSLTTNNWTLVGRKEDANAGTGATGSVNMSGGTWTKNGETNFVVGDTGPGTMNMIGGLVIVNPHAAVDRGITWIGNRNSTTGTLSISGGAEFRSPRFVLAVQSATTGTLNLNGGTVKTTGITGGVGTSTVNFNGTQIIATGNSNAFIDALTNANLNAGGLVVDSAGFNLIAPQGLTGTGGVVKNGAGTLTLNGFNNYTGNHIVNGGKLAVAADATDIGSFTVANGAAMGVIQSFGSSLNVSNVTLGTSAASSLDIDLGDFFGNPSTAPLDVTGTLALNGAVTLNIDDLEPDLGPIPLVTYNSKTGSGSFVAGRLPLGVIGTLTDNNAGLVSFTVTEISFPHWVGNTNGNWDTTTENWLDPLKYKDPLPVTFDDGATGTTTVILNGTVSPGNVAFNNETLPYTLGGAGKITGTTGLAKTGAGTVGISTTNDYTGATTLSGGTTSVAVLSNGGVASPLGAASAAVENLVLNGGTLEYTGGNTTIDRGLSVTGPGGGILNANNLTLTGAFASAAGSNFNKSGAGVLNLTNATVTLGGTGQFNEVRGGTLAFTGPGQTVSVPGDLRVGTVASTAGNLTVQDSNLTVTGGSVFASAAGSTSTVILGGTSVYTANNTFQMSTNTTGVCNMTIQDTARLVRGANGHTSIGNDGPATLTVKNSGTVTAPGDFNIGDVGTSNGTLNVQDNATVSTTGIFFVGKNSGTTGTVNLTGGTMNSTTYITIGRRGGATGHFNISGGTLNQTDAGAGFIVGENGAGTLTVSGTGVLDINGGGLYLSAEAAGTSNSKAYLNGGTIIAKRVVQRDFNGANYTEFHFNGGILRAKAGASADFMSSHDLVSVDAGGAFIDSNGQTITISQALAGTGALTKQGAGTLTLSGANTYAGNTTVSGGTLSLTTAYLANTSTVSIALGAVLNLTHGATDQVGGLTIADGPPLPVGTYDAGTHPGVITGTGKLQVIGTASPFGTWISGFPSIPVADRDPGDDPDRDGLNNGIEFIVGGNPSTTPDNGKAPVQTKVPGGIQFVYRRTDLSASSNPGVEHNAALTGTWIEAVNGVGGVTVTPENDFFGAGVDKVTVFIPTTDPKHFARLKVVIP